MPVLNPELSWEELKNAVEGDERTPEQVAAYEAEVERLAQIASDIPY